MKKDDKIWAAVNDAGEDLFLLPRMANRHGLIAGATGTGKTVTARVLAESFSDMGVPVFVADVKGDLAGIMAPGTDSEDMQKRIQRFGLADTGFTYTGYPVALWDIYGEKGMPLRTTVSEMGPLLMARILQLNDLQSDILSVVFRIADDNNLLLIDIKDLKAMLNYVQEHAKEYAEQYGRMSSASIGVILRALVALEGQGGDMFFGETALNISDWMQTYDGKGMINILDSVSLFNTNGKLYSTFLLWFLSELFEMMPEVGDLPRPKMVFFFDEAHLLFKDASKDLLDKIEQVVKLIRSRGIGIYFCTQNPRDIPDAVLAQLGNRVQHALRAYTPADQKAVRAAPSPSGRILPLIPWRHFRLWGPVKRCSPSSATTGSLRSYRKPISFLRRAGWARSRMWRETRLSRDTFSMESIPELMTPNLLMRSFSAWGSKPRLQPKRQRRRLKSRSFLNVSSEKRKKQPSAKR